MTLSSADGCTSDDAVDGGIQGKAPNRVHPVVWIAIGVAVFAAVFLFADLFGLIDVGKPPSAASLSGHAAESPTSVPTVPATDLASVAEQSGPSTTTAASKSRENWWERDSIFEGVSARSNTSNATATTSGAPLASHGEPKGQIIWDNEPAGGSPLSPSDTRFDAARVNLISDAEKSVVAIRNGTKQGSGFVVDASGIIVTNYHVIEGATGVEVEFSGGESFAAAGWVGISPDIDLALIQCSMPNNTRPLVLAERLPVKTEAVFALGSPLGLEGTVSSGIVSGIRTDSLPGRSGKDTVLIQSTAPISHGSSGGPLINTEGKVIGVNTMSLVEGQNLNFAVSSRHVADLVKAAAKVGQLWSKLPPPRPDPEAIARAEEDRQRRLVQEKAKEAVAGLQSSLDERNKRQVVEGELNRIVARAGDLERAISVIEAEGTVLTQQRGQVVAAREGIFHRGREVEDQIAILQSNLQQCRMLLNAAIINQLEDRIALRRAQMAEIEAQLYRLSQSHTDLKAQMVSLGREAGDLQGQINYKASQRDQLKAERAALRSRYDEIRGN